MFGDEITAKLVYFTRVAGGQDGEPANASLCENCGQCEDACPQKLPIQELLEKVTIELEESGSSPQAGLGDAYEIFKDAGFLAIKDDKTEE